MDFASPIPRSGEDAVREALRQLIGGVVPSNRFYSGKLAAVGDSLFADSTEDFAQRFPFTTKAELGADQVESPPYGTNLTFPLNEYTRLHQTSGTTGVPLRWLDTPESWSVIVRDWAEVWRHAGVTSADRIFFAFSFGPFLGFWAAFEAAQSLGVLVVAGGGMSSALRARVVLENQCTVLCATPTYALHLASQARAEGLDMGKSVLRLILVAGEPGGSQPIIRARLSEAWNGARVFDHHGMTEVGPVTYESPERPGHLVVLERSHHVEVIDPTTTAPVPPGGEGELVVTTLRRLASPAIRYRTGDLVRAIRPTPDSALELAGGILGRVDDMVVVRGVNVYPSAIHPMIHSIPEIGEYRVTVDARQPLVELSVEVEGPNSAAKELERRFHSQLALRIPVTAVSAGTLPHSEMKARRWRRLT